VKPFALPGLLCALWCLTLSAPADEADDLVKNLKSKDVESRVATCEALGKLGPKAKNAVVSLDNLASKDSSKIVRRAAINALEQIGPLARSATGSLIVVFKENAELRADAGKALARVGGAAAVPALKGLLPADKKGNDNALRSAAATTLGDIGPDAKPAVKALHALLTEKDAGLQHAAIVALGKIGPDAREAIPELLELMSDKDAKLKLAAIEAVGRIGAESKISVKMLAGLVDSPDSQVGPLAIEGLARMGKNAVPVLVEGLKKPDANRRLLILRAMVANKMDARGAVAELLVLTSDENHEVRKLSRTVLDGLGKGAVAELIKVLKDPAQPETSHVAAAAALATIVPGKDNLLDLVRLLKDAKVELRRAAADALAKLGPDAIDVLAELIAAMRDDDGAVRAGVGRAIKNTGRPGAAKLQGMLAKETDAAVKANLATALRLTTFGGKETTLPALIDALADKEDIVARAAAEMLGGLGESAVDPLVGALKDPNPSVRRHATLALKDIGATAKKAVPLLTEALNDADPATRQFAALALGKIGPGAKAATSGLVNGMLRDREKEVRQNCAKALLSVDPEPRLAAPAFRQALRDRAAAVVDSAIEGLTNLGAAAVNELSDALKDKDEEVRRAAVEILGNLGAAAKPALPALQDAARDSNARVAATAKKVLEKLYQARFLQLLNELRTKSDRRPLILDPILMRVTQDHAKLMAKEKRTDPKPLKQPAEQVRDAGFKFDTIGLFQLPARELNADMLYDALINGARDLFLKPELSDIGIGIDADDANNYYIAILYAAKTPGK
jgi:HEAT repeat protein